MKRQRIIFAVFALTVIFALTGCGQTAQQAPEAPLVSEGVETQQETPAVESTTDALISEAPVSIENIETSSESERVEIDQASSTVEAPINEAAPTDTPESTNTTALTDTPIPTGTPATAGTPASIDAATPSVESVGEENNQIDSVKISFTFNRMSTHASNQFAVWIEDADGKLVKTLFVPNFTAARRGYQVREDAVLSWVSAAKPDAMTDAEIDAISSATPSTGTQAFSWDMTDTEGNRVPDGIYKIMVEGTLYWSSTVLYTAELDTENATDGELTIVETRSEPNNTDNETMLKNVRISAIVGGNTK